jgi:hypothetical protein
MESPDRPGSLDFKVLVVDNFLSAAQAGECLAEAIWARPLYHQAKVYSGQGGATAINEKHRRNEEIFLDTVHPRSTIIKHLSSRFASDEMRTLFHTGYMIYDVVNYATRRSITLNRFGEDSDHFDKHRDTIFQPGQLGHRLITAMYYMHAEPRKFTGGRLRVWPQFPDAGTDAEDASWFEPLHNRLIVFPSFAYHAVEPLKPEADSTWEDGRFSVNWWMGF